MVRDSASSRHAVQRDVEHLHQPEGRDQRQRHGQRRDQGRPPIPEEQPDHDHRQQRAQAQRLSRRVEAVLGVDVRRGDLLDLHLGVRLLDLGDRSPGRPGDGDLARALGALDREADHRPIVEPGDAARLGPLVDHHAQVLQAHGLAIGQVDAHLLQVVDGLGAAQGAHRLFLVADLPAAARKIGVRQLQLLADLARRDAEGAEPAGIELDADLAVDAAGAGDRGHALHPHHLLGDGVLDEPGELLRIHRR